ncbi:MAG: MEDS domain-containing protein [Bacteroidetes bacterium]|nr:MEDS domain-containing protein [Bacteroidota bacterium]
MQIYENDEMFLDLLEGFVIGGIKNHECVILIATPAHLGALQYRLKREGYDVPSLVDDDQLIMLDAQETLNCFMVNDEPDEKKFNSTISKVIKKAHNRQRKIRAFGEMVAILWENGKKEATVELENLWNKFCTKEAFSLFCAYPKSSFIKDEQKHTRTICSCHTKIISGSMADKNEIVYRTVFNKLIKN